MNAILTIVFIATAFTTSLVNGECKNKTPHSLQVDFGASCTGVVASMAPPPQATCTDLWKDFSGAFAFKDTTYVSGR